MQRLVWATALVALATGCSADAAPPSKKQSHERAPVRRRGAVEAAAQ